MPKWCVNGTLAGERSHMEWRTTAITSFNNSESSTATLESYGMWPRATPKAHEHSATHGTALIQGELSEDTGRQCHKKFIDKKG